MENVFYRTLLSHVVRSKFILKSRFCHTELNTHVKRVRTIESFFASNRSQTESEKNNTQDEQCINQDEMDEDQRKPKKS